MEMVSLVDLHKHYVGGTFCEKNHQARPTSIGTLELIGNSEGQNQINN